MTEKRESLKELLDGYDEHPNYKYCAEWARISGALRLAMEWLEAPSGNESDAAEAAFRRAVEGSESES